MELTSPTIIKELLAKQDARPSKGLGQNFLIDKNVLRKIIEAGDIQPTDTILEVGPGIGVLTRELAQKAGKVIAVEKDETMIEILKETVKDFGNIEVINGDILQNKLDLPAQYKVIANIPYYLTSPLIRKFLESENQPQAMVLMLQKEVAQRICSKPGDMSLLAVSVQFYAEAKIISYVPKNCFWPAPKIDSAIIKITPVWKNRRPSLSPDIKSSNTNRENVDTDLFFKVAKAGFSHPRKQLVNNLASLQIENGVKSSNLNRESEKEQISNWLLKNNINPSRRAETLDVSDWIHLTESFKIFNI